MKRKFKVIREVDGQPPTVWRVGTVLETEPTSIFVNKQTLVVITGHGTQDEFIIGRDVEEIEMSVETTVQCIGRRRIKARRGEGSNVELEVVIGEEEKHLATLVLVPEEAAKLRDVMMRITEEPI